MVEPVNATEVRVRFYTNQTRPGTIYGVIHDAVTGELLVGATAAYCSFCINTRGYKVTNIVWDVNDS